jgi:hypothetical protein
VKTILVAALAVLIATPVLAQTQPESKAKTTAKKPGKAAVSEQEPRRTYSTNPEHDVYFRGEYVGSDPDPRIRWTLRDEARRSYGLSD